MREPPRNQDLINSLQCTDLCLRRKEKDPKVDTHFLVGAFRQNKATTPKKLKFERLERQP